MSKQSQSNKPRASRPLYKPPQKRPVEKTTKGQPLAASLAGKTMGLTPEEKRNLRTIVSTPPTATAGCHLPPAKSFKETVVDDRLLFYLAKSLCFQLNNELQWIPKSSSCPGWVYLYLKRCLAQHFHNCGMLPMPAINANDFVIPAWIGIVFQSLSPFQEGKIEHGIRPSNYSAGTLDEETVGSDLALVELQTFSTQFIVGVQNGEDLFGSTGVVGPITIGKMDQLSATFSGLKKKTQVRSLDIRTTSPGFYISGETAFTFSSPLEAFLTPYTGTMHYIGDDVPEWKPFGFTPAEGALFALEAIHSIDFAKGKSFRSAFKEAGLPIDTLSVKQVVANGAWLNSVVADALLANTDILATSSAFWWDTWNILRVLWISYYLSFTSTSVLTTISPGPAWKNKQHRQAYVTPQAAMLQKCGFYKSKRCLTVLVPPACGTPLCNQFVSTSLNYTEFIPAAFDQSYFEGTLSTAIVPPVVLGAPPGGQYFNFMPLSVYDSFDIALKQHTFRLQRIPEPRLHHCLCFVAAQGINDTYTVQAITIHYKSFEAIDCNYTMSNEMCCWMYAGCVAQTNDLRSEGKYHLTMTDRANHLRLIATACAVRGSAVVAGGQTQDLGKSFVEVVKNQMMEHVKKGVVDMPINQLVSYAKDYVGQRLGDSFDAPSWEQIATVLSGQTNLSTAAHVLGTGLLAFGGRILLGFKGNHVVPVRTEL